MTGSSAVSRRRPLALLVAGVVGGLALAAVGLLESGGRAAADAPAARALGAEVVASVNGTPIPRHLYAQLLAGVEAETEQPADAAMRRHVLDRLVDEELLVQRGLELGLASRDREVRSDLAAAVIRSVLVETEDAEPSPQELHAFYAEHRALFERPERLHVRQLALRSAPGPDPAAEARAEAAARRLRAGEPLARLRAELDEAPAAPVPDAPLPLRTLREYLGGAAVEALQALAPGEVSRPVRSAGALRVLVLVAREPAAAPPLAEVEAQVAAEWRRQRGEEALRAYLERLRERAAIRLAPSAP